LLGSVLALHEYQHWRLKTVAQLLSKRVELSIFGSAVDEALPNGAGGCVSEANQHFDGVVCHYLSYYLFDSRLHSGTKQEFSYFVIVLKICQYLINLLQEAHFEHFVCFVNHKMIQGFESELLTELRQFEWS